MRTYLKAVLEKLKILKDLPQGSFREDENIKNMFWQSRK